MCKWILWEPWKWCQGADAAAPKSDLHFLGDAYLFRCWCVCPRCNFHGFHEIHSPNFFSQIGLFERKEVCIPTFLFNSSYSTSMLIQSNVDHGHIVCIHLRTNGGKIWIARTKYQGKTRCAHSCKICWSIWFALHCNLGFLTWLTNPIIHSIQHQQVQFVKLIFSSLGGQFPKFIEVNMQCESIWSHPGESIHIS